MRNKNERLNGVVEDTTKTVYVFQNNMVRQLQPSVIGRNLQSVVYLEFVNLLDFKNQNSYRPMYCAPYNASAVCQIQKNIFFRIRISLSVMHVMQKYSITIDDSTQVILL